MKYTLVPIIVGCGLLLAPASQAENLEPLTDAEADDIAREELAREIEAAEAIQAKMDAQTIISRQIRTNGSQTTICEEILPPAPSTSTLSPSSSKTASLAETSIAAEVLDQKTLFLSAWIVGDSGLTKIQWRHHDVQFEAWSNIDFRVFQSHANFVGTDGVAWFILMSLERAESGRLLDDAQRPALQRLANAREPLYLLFEKNTGSIPDEALHGIESLHDYYAAHESELQIHAQRALALHEARERLEASTPVSDKPLRIQFFRP